MGSSFDVLTLGQAAELTGISPSILARWADQGRIPFYLGKDGQRLFKREDLAAVILRLEEGQDDQ